MAHKLGFFFFFQKASLLRQGKRHHDERNKYLLWNISIVSQHWQSQAVLKKGGGGGGKVQLVREKPRMLSASPTGLAP